MQKSYQVLTFDSFFCSNSIFLVGAALLKGKQGLNSSFL
jgi:hypothetical protein